MDLSPEEIRHLLDGEMLEAEDQDGNVLQLVLMSVVVPSPRSTTHQWHMVPAVACGRCHSLMAAEDSCDLSDDLLVCAVPCPGDL